MGLTRKLQKVGNSPTVAIPSQLAAMINIKAGVEKEFDHIGEGTHPVAEGEITARRRSHLPDD